MFTPEMINQETSSFSFNISILLDPIVLSGILVTGLLGSAYAYWAQSACQRHLEPAKVALIFATEPVFAFLSAWVFLGEVLGFKGSLGALLILAAILVSELGHTLTDKSLFKNIRGQKPN
jgi:drug/metabolite transporter (DMT)-like permease